MWNGILVAGSGAKKMRFQTHPKNQALLIGEDNLIYQLTDTIPDVAIATYELDADGNMGMYANYAEDGEYKA